MQRNDLGVLPHDIFTRQKAFIDASCPQNLVQIRGTGAVVACGQAADFHGKPVQMWCQTRYKIEFNNDFVIILVHALDRDSTDVLTSVSIHATRVGSDNCYTPRGGSHRLEPVALTMRTLLFLFTSPLRATTDAVITASFLFTPPVWAATIPQPQAHEAGKPPLLYGGVYRGRTDVICLEGRGINRYTNTPQDCG